MPEPSPPAGPKKPAAPAKPAAAKPGAPAKAGDKAAPAAKDGAAAAEPARPPLQAELRARLSRGKAARFEVGAGGVVLGRDDSAPVAIPLEGVSREHARVQWDGKGWWIEDLKSTNGTFLNGERVARERLQHLDVIGLGRKADLVFVLRTPQEAPQVRQGIVRAALVDADGATHEIATGELTMGRSVACNVVADLSAVSKVHARIERSSDQLLLEDLGSSNGTFVNGSRVRTAILRHGDTLELAKAVRFNVVVETGEVRSSGTYRALPAVKEGEPRFSGDWKTRYEWESGEMAAFAAAAAGVRPDEGELQTADGTVLKKPPKPPAAAAPVAKPAAPAAAAKPAAPAAAAKPAATAPPAPAAPVVPPPAAVATPSGAAAIPTRAASSKPSLQEVAAARSAAPAAPAPPAPPPPTPAKAPAAAAAGEDPISATVTDMPALAAPAAPGPIAVARFTADKFAFTVDHPGRYEVGRATATAIRVDHTTVSRRHAAITLGEDRRTLVAEDLGAANGTRLNGREIKGAQALQEGDVLQLGEVSFKVALERS